MLESPWGGPGGSMGGPGGSLEGPGGPWGGFLEVSGALSEDLGGPRRVVEVPAEGLGAVPGES